MSDELKKYRKKLEVLEDSLTVFDKNCYLLNGTPTEDNIEDFDFF